MRSYGKRGIRVSGVLAPGDASSFFRVLSLRLPAAVIALFALPLAHDLAPLGFLAEQAALAVAAQSLEGSVIRPDQTPLPDVSLVLRTETGEVLARTTSDDAGRFELEWRSQEEPLRLEATLLGYSDWRTEPFELTADAELELLIQMEIAAIPLDPVEVNARSRPSLRRLAGFERRMESPPFGGHFIVAEEIARRPMSRPSNLVLDAPGMTVAGGRGPFDRYTIYSTYHADCPTAVFVDGVRIQQTARSVDEYLELERIAGVEVYPRMLQAPPQYQNNLEQDCGVVLYWTKEPEPDQEGGWSRTKIGVGVSLIAGLLGLGLIL